MSDLAQIDGRAARRRVAQEPLRQLTVFDWLFIAMAWLTCAYFAYNVLKYFDPNDKDGFDFMPIVAGIPTVLAGWQAVRLHEQVDAALAGLDSGAALVVMDESTMSAFLVDLKATAHWWSRACGLFIAATMVAILVVLMWTGVRSTDLDVDTIAKNGALAVVMIGVGWLIGLLLGRLAGFGQLYRVMTRHRIEFAGLSTPEAQAAMRSLEGVFSFAMLSTIVMCHWFAGWWVMWNLGFDPKEYRELWMIPFLIMWAISFTLYIVAALRPALAFQRRLDALYGGSDMRRAIDVKLAAAGAELAELEASQQSADRRRRAEIAEIARYVQDLKERRFRSWRLNPYLLYALVAWNVVLFALPLLLGGFAVLGPTGR